MSNKHKGEVRVEVCGASILLVLDHNALCELEEALNKDTASIVTKMFKDGAAGRVSAKLLRTIIWAAMLHSLPETTLKEAGDVANELGSNLVEVVGELFMQNGLLDIGEATDPEEEAPSGNGESSQG